jgi:solute carrier family 29 (equilibrative nucleoside transporter), member 1/2/3
MTAMDRVKNLFRPSPEYEPIQDGQREEDEVTEQGSDTGNDEPPFSRVEYSIFLLLGVAMLWAW